MNTAALIGRKELNAIMDKLITRCQYYIKHLVRGVLISTCFLKLKLQDLYQNFMEDLIHSPENCFLGENIFEPCCRYGALERTATQELVLWQVKFNFKNTKCLSENMPHDLCLSLYQSQV